MTEEAAGPRQVGNDEARQMVGDGAQLIDVRVDHEWEVGHLAGATHLPLEDLPERSAELDSDRPVVVYCRTGIRSQMATEALTDAGFDAVKLSDGIVGWEEEGLELEPEGGYVAESGEAAAILQARKKAT